MSEMLYEQVRELVRLSGSRFVRAEFVKKDGSIRTMVFQPRYVAYIKGEDASEAAQRAVQTRRENHPELLNQFDINKGAPRSINMDTLISMKVRGSLFMRVGDLMVQQEE